MGAAIYALLGAAFFVATALALGTLLLRSLALKLYRTEERLLGFVVGSAVLSAIVFALCTVKLARKGVFLALGAAALFAVLRRGGYRARGEAFPALPRPWRFLLTGVFAVFTVYYFFTAWAPENSPDGMAYHLWVVFEYARAHGFVRIPTSFYANLSQGLELLFLYAFVFGKHSAAALVHFSYLATLPFLILSYGHRFGFPRAAAAAGLFVFVAPVVGMDGSVAYVDVAMASIAFALFYLLQIWDQERNSRWLVPVGILAGFAFAVKYTGFVAVLYAVGLVAWKLLRARKPLLRPVLMLAALSLIFFILPWTLKNYLWLGNPVIPFANRIFPNPWVHVWFEDDYRKFMRVYALTSWKQAPLQLTVHGDILTGIVGPLFLAAPLAFLALRRREGRQVLLAAAIFLATYFGNIGTRFLIPCLPFVALGMALALESLPRVLLVITLANALACLPPLVNRYAPNAWRLLKVPYREALRIKSEDAFLNEVAPPYAMARLIEEKVPPNEKVYSFSGSGRSYTRRELMLKYESGPGDTMGDILWAPMFVDFQPTHAMDFHFPAHAVKKLRLIETAKTTWMWSVSELRVYAGGVELLRAPDWRLTARPNPWEVQLAFDNSPGTRWRSWQVAEPGMYMEVDFGAARSVDAVKVQRSYDEDQSRYRVDGMDADGRWTTLSDKPVESLVGITVNLRQAATDEIKRRGYHYLLVDSNDIGADDYFRNAAVWGLSLVGQRGGSRLYRID
ncbi:MAG: discoidin domain-containing protein [Acidobacteriota bacterium]|nr:discoidin domain-containing protein [Acidobacteriota bacterium]